jgi:hypothetical protein
VIRVYDESGNVIETRLESSSALNQIEDEDDESNYEQEVDQAAANVAEQAKKPEH